jgi:hypothetical protein
MLHTITPLRLVLTLICCASLPLSVCADDDTSPEDLLKEGPSLAQRGDHNAALNAFRKVTRSDAAAHLQATAQRELAAAYRAKSVADLSDDASRRAGELDTPAYRIDRPTSSTPPTESPSPPRTYSDKHRQQLDALDQIIRDLERLRR